jgi:hypothetical protein
VQSFGPERSPGCRDRGNGSTVLPGKRWLLRQIFVHRAGHCAFTPAETITAVQALVSRLDTGRWDRSALGPVSLNAQAAALGPQCNIFQVGNTVVPAPPAFLRYRPARYLRPFDLAPGG